MAEVAGEHPLGFCTDCTRVRWLAVVDGFTGVDTPFGTCTQCAREAEESLSNEPKEG